MELNPLQGRCSKDSNRTILKKGSKMAATMLLAFRLLRVHKSVPAIHCSCIRVSIIGRLMHVAPTSTTSDISLRGIFRTDQANPKLRPKIYTAGQPESVRTQVTSLYTMCTHAVKSHMCEHCSSMSGICLTSFWLLLSLMQYGASRIIERRSRHCDWRC